MDRQKISTIGFRDLTIKRNQDKNMEKNRDLRSRARVLKDMDEDVEQAAKDSLCYLCCFCNEEAQKNYNVLECLKCNSIQSLQLNLEFRKLKTEHSNNCSKDLKLSMEECIVYCLDCNFQCNL